MPSLQQVAEFLRRQCPSLGFRIFVHGTPRQWQDSQRAWLGREKDVFVDTFTKEGVDTVLRWYERGQEGSLDQHFRVLEAFDVNVGNRACVD